MHSSRIALGFAIAALVAATSSAHDLWLIAEPVVGETVVVSANVGMEFPKSVQAPDTAKFKRTHAIGPDGGEIPVKAAGKRDLSGLLQFEAKRPGIYQLAVETEPKLIELSAEAFNEYLVSDGLTHIYRLRHKEDTLDQPGRERYRKSPKTLIQIGPGEGDNWSKVLGLILEIVPLRNPFALKAGDALPVRVLFQGKPLPEANLGWQLPGDGETARGTVRTDDKGEALIPIARADLMTIRLTHMTRPKAGDYEWESFWTTLTFRVP